MNPATIVWRQITTQTKMAIGANQPLHSNSGNTLTFRVTINRGTTHKIVVDYDQGKDSYNIKLYAIRGTKIKVERECQDVYAEDLNRIIYDYCHNK